MIDYSKYKKFYSTGGEFYLSGTDFSGYVEVFNGIPCESGTRKLLTPIQTFSTDVKLSKYFYDRVVDDEAVLPFSRESILINNNDFLTYDLIAERLKRLHENNTYIFSRLFLPSNNIPFTENVSFLALKTANDTTLNLLTSFEGNTTFTDSANFKVLGNIKDFVVKRNNEFSDTYAFFGITDTEFVTLTSNRSSTDIIEVSNKVETEQNSLTFTSLEHISINDTHAFISDSTNNVVYKYEIAGYFNGDYALANKRNFIELIGGEGAVSDPTRFKSPKQITCNNNNIVVYDSGNYICKVYDINFNYIQQIRGIPLKVETLVALEFNDLSNNLYIVTITNARNIKLYVYDGDFILQETYILDEELEDGEVITNITFSNNDSNIWYLCTNMYVYKKLINRPQSRVGRFQTQNLFANNINTYAYPQKEWRNYETSTTTQVSSLSTVSNIISVSALSATSFISAVTSLSSYTFTTNITSLSTTTRTNTVSSLSSVTFFTTITTVSARTVSSPLCVLSAFTYNTIISSLSTLQTISPAVSLSSYTTIATISSLSSRSFTIPITSAIQGNSISVAVTSLSTQTTFITSVNTSDVSNVDYFNVDIKIPVNNYWNNTFIKFHKAQFFWNTINVDIKKIVVAVRKPYQYYRFVMYSDEKLTVVQGSSGIPGSNPVSKPFGLYKVQLDIGWQPKYTSFKGWEWQQVKGNTPLQYSSLKPGSTVTTAYSAPTFTITAPSFISGTPFLNYVVRGDFYKLTQNNIYLYPPTQIFTLDNALQPTPGDSLPASNAWIPAVSGREATTNNAYVEIDLTAPVSLSGIKVLAKSPPTINTPRTPPFIKVFGSNDGSTFYAIGSGALPNIPNNTGRYIDIDLYEEAEIETSSIISNSKTVLVSSLSAGTIYTAVTSLSTGTLYNMVTALSTNTFFTTTTSFNISSLTTIVTAYSANTTDVVLYYTVNTILTSYNFDTKIDQLSVTKWNTYTTELSSIINSTITGLVTGYSFSLSSQALSTIYFTNTLQTYDLTISNHTATFAGVVDDIFKACRVVRTPSNYDDIILFSNGRIYFIPDPSTYTTILKKANYENYGGTRPTLTREEYIQASTLNKEIYKVVYDIFTLKNNIIGRFEGFYDKDVFTLMPKGYNYNIDYLDITNQEFVEGYLTSPNFEKYYINENEKTIVGVINRALESVYNLQVDIFNKTKVDRGSEIIPVFNNIGTVLLD